MQPEPETELEIVPSTLTIQIVTGRKWYKRAVGKEFEVVKRGGHYAVYGQRSLRIDKDHAVVTAVNYKETEPCQTSD